MRAVIIVCLMIVIPKRVRFKEKEVDSVEMLVDPMPTPTLSWKDLFQRKTIDLSGGTGGCCGEDFDFVEGDFTRTTVNEIPAVDFFDRV
ncbi:hypothetical protein J1N35_025614 [Gossypium stocksii]|uniref:Uncharacterized protein n=1 Tax=Gossypium stocksii TaxID=47602 RepID=A0A9D3V6X1_9ROSI|nr:hypothetical protein J1N35_025614 [Gossypium stocksii]